MERPELEGRSQTFAVEVMALCAQVRTHPDGRTPADQLLDAATSVGANYRASSRARSRAEFVAKLGTVSEEIGASGTRMGRALNQQITSSKITSSSDQQVDSSITSSPHHEITR
jgi:four helix bundle protein